MILSLASDGDIVVCFTRSAIQLFKVRKIHKKIGIISAQMFIEILIEKLIEILWLLAISQPNDDEELFGTIRKVLTQTSE